MSGDARRRILERRATFIAAAIASLGAGACESRPTVCLSAVADETSKPPSPDDATAASVAPRPAVCLSEPMRPPDAGAAETGPHPAPCLSVKPRHDAGPMPCLELIPEK